MNPVFYVPKRKNVRIFAIVL